MARASRAAAGPSAFTLPAEVTDVFQSYSLLKTDDAGIAHGFLTRAALIAAPVARKRGWKVGRLREFAPKNASLLGLNVNRGQEICVRTRSANGFLDEDSILGTLLHELVHIVHGSHSVQFYDMLKELWIDAESTMFRQRFNLPDPHANPKQWGEGRTLGGQVSLPQARIRQFSFGNKLGGTIDPALKPREAAARAALARLRIHDSHGCGTQEAPEDEDVIYINRTRDYQREHVNSNGEVGEIINVAEDRNKENKFPEIVSVDGNQTIDKVDEDGTFEDKIAHDLFRGKGSGTIAGTAPHSQSHTIDLTLGLSQDSDDEEKWTCASCTFKNDNAHVLCACCSETRLDHWRCTRCSYMNKREHLQCDVCHEMVPHPTANN